MPGYSRSTQVRQFTHTFQPGFTSVPQEAHDLVTPSVTGFAGAAARDIDSPGFAVAGDVRAENEVAGTSDSASSDQPAIDDQTTPIIQINPASKAVTSFAGQMP